MMLRRILPKCRIHDLRAIAPVVRPFSATSSESYKALPPRPKPPPDSDIQESYLKGSGPGGQKINKTNSAVQLKHIPTGIVVKSQATRSRDQNRKHAREILAQKVDEHLNGDQARSAVVGRIKQKRSASADKKKKRKYKKLDEERATENGEEELLETTAEEQQWEEPTPKPQIKEGEARDDDTSRIAVTRIMQIR